MTMYHFMKNLLTGVFLLIILSDLSYAQSPMDAAWESFKTNDIETATQQFREAAEEGNADALLMLSLLSSVYETPEKAFGYFTEFFECSGNPYPHLWALWIAPSVNNGFGPKTDEQLEFLEKLTMQEDADGTINSLAWEMLGRAYDAIGEFESADENYFLNVGSITKWQVVGEFENISASGFDKEQQALYHPEPDYVFRNKRNARVQWFDLPHMRPGVWVDLVKHFYYSNSIVFAQTFCQSPVEQVVQLRIGTSGSLKAWVNDKLVFSERKERNNHIDTYNVTIKLDKGFNRILLQLGESEAGRLNFLCRTTDDRGFNINGLKFHTEYSPEKISYSSNYTFRGKQVPIFAETFFREKMKKEPEDLLNYIMLSQCYMTNDKTYEARKVLEKAVELAPDCSYILSQLIELYAREENRTGLSTTIEKIRMTDPEHPISLDYDFDEAIDNEEYEEAKTILVKYRNIFGEDEKYFNKKLSILSSEKKREKMVETVEEAYKKFPDNLEFTYWMYLQTRDMTGDHERAIAILKDYHDRYFVPELVTTLVSYHFDRNNSDEAFELLERLTELDPASDSYYNKIGDRYFGMRKYEEAGKYYRKCIEISPYVSSYWGDLAETFEEQGEKQKAIGAYEKCIEYYPTKYDKRTSLRKLKGQKPVFDYFGEPDLYSLYENSPESGDYPNDNGILLFNESHRVVYPGGGSEQKNYMLAKIFTAAGIDDWKEFRIPSAGSRGLTVEKAEVLKKDGSRMKAEVSGSHVLYTALEEGDGILLIYKIEHSLIPLLYEHFWEKHFFTLYFPSLHSSYKLLVPTGTEFSYEVSNSDLKPEIGKNGEFDIYTWTRDSLDGIKYESLMPSLVDVGEVLHISSIPSWDFIADWYWDYSTTKARADFEVKELVSSILDGNGSLTDLGKVKLFYDYVVRNIRYSYIPFRQSGLIPQKASTTINTKIGDCKDVSTLFAAMCREIGIESNIVLVSTRNNGRKFMRLPSIDFNHAIASCNIDGEKYYIELTNDYNPFGTIYGDLLDAFVLEIDSNDTHQAEPVFLDPASRKKSLIFRKSKITFKGEDMLCSKKTTKTGGQAAHMRSYYRDEGSEQRENRMYEAISEDYPNIRLDKLEFDENINTTGDTVTYLYEYTVRNSFNRVLEDLYLLKIPFADRQAPLDFISNEKRKFPLEFRWYSRNDFENERIIMELPKDKVLAEIPEKISLHSEFGSYTLDFRMNGDFLEIERSMQYRSKFVPLEKYYEFSRFFENIIKSDSRQLAFREKK